MNNNAHLRPNDYDNNGDIIPDAMREDRGDLISRSALKEAIENHFDMLDAYFPIKFIEEIDNAPTVKPCENCDLYFKAMAKEEMRND